MHRDIKKIDDKVYKSPLRKLVRFFETSRNKWKAKCQAAKYQNKLLKNKVWYLQRRKAELNKRVKQLEKEISRQGLKKTLK